MGKTSGSHQSVSSATGNSGIPGIRVDNLTLRFGNHTVFNKLTFEIKGGEFAVLLGESGVGKSSLLKIIAGLSNATSGNVCGTDGQPLNNRIAYMGQQDLLYPWLNLFENVTLGARLRREKVDKRWAEHLLERVGLANRRTALPAELSGGMRQRAAIARTLYEQRPIVLMDEPFSALDAITRVKVQDLAAELLEGCTALFITHDPMEACRLGHCLMVLSGLPAGIGKPITIAGNPPRSLDDPELQRSQGELLRLFVEQAQ
ncbi:ABC transporter ATP-binding protein [Prodigiosinella aquatilis]|nr:ABC transporter ATP-binding protein [Prodigiosinella sp. LS101]WJV53697.1 ABC transporter ATP-binding protein [Prodigiosinella sp. LS101]WJV58056.1 ABC transporter ATP-binding protein [Pectobacteriaceae bacterium C111]